MIGYEFHNATLVKMGDNSRTHFLLYLIWSHSAYGDWENMNEYIVLYIVGDYNSTKNSVSSVPI